MPALSLSALRQQAARSAPLPILGRVTDFALVDQSNAPVARTAFDGEPWIASFVFTRCPLVCPRLSDHMRALQALAQRGDAKIHLVTFSIDPEHDTPAVLGAYADGYGADRRRWSFLTGSEGSIQQVVRSFSVALEGTADPTKPDFGIMHSGHLVLVDGQARIRGYYPSAENGVESRILADLERIGTS
ncbi:SCO family protein [Candidatus Binatia bacterium]|nr:SCO family protein [Candidatus Binatia bacterium]